MKVKNDEQCEVLMNPLAFSLCDGEGSKLLGEVLAKYLAVTVRVIFAKGRGRQEVTPKLFLTMKIY